MKEKFQPILQNYNHKRFKNNMPKPYVYFEINKIYCSQFLEGTQHAWGHTTKSWGKREKREWTLKFCL